jgi:hypothetical protein
MARAELFIWWTTDEECRQIGSECSATLPDYVRAQYALRVGRAGRGRLWSDPRFGEREITDWPKTMIARMIEDSGAGGIVFQSKDLPLFKDEVGGLVTDFKLRIMVVK